MYRRGVLGVLVVVTGQMRALMRSATALEPLASAQRADLVEPLTAVLHALLGPP